MSIILVVHFFCMWATVRPTLLLDSAYAWRVNQSSLLVTNPGSRSGGDNLDSAAETLGRDGAVKLIRPERPEDLPAALRDHGSAVDRIVLAGGDGTINLALDTLLELDKPLGILPLGTANDLARSLDIPTRLDKAVEVIMNGHLRRVDLARVNDVSFINAIGIGLGPRMTEEMDAESKASLGVLAYFKGIIQAFQRPPAFTAKISSHERERQGEYVQITIANGIHYGGGMTVASDAKLDDGQLDILLVPRQSQWSLLGNALRFRTGTTSNADALIHWRSNAVRVETEVPMPITADGEFLTETPAECQVLPSSLSVFAPA